MPILKSLTFINLVHRGLDPAVTVWQADGVEGCFGYWAATFATLGANMLPPRGLSAPPRMVRDRAGRRRPYG
jgi:hypothetical protein